MDRSNESSSILKGVVAYVDVWSSNKTENYSKPFIDQLGEMGAEVSKTLNKHVTHVVFKDGHQGTWNKAKKIGAKVVSVLWLARCKDEAEFVDEELFPAQNDEGNHLLKKRTHRCMQPKDSAEKTPENNRRMKKKLDKMIKDLAPLPLQSPLFLDVSPYIIDEEHSIVYSPSMKRSDSMARRLKEMREKRENLSPTASQMVEAAASSPGVKPLLGFSPSILKLLEDNSDEETSSAVTTPHRSPETRGEYSRRADAGPHRAAEKPWLSPCSDVPKRKSLAHFKALTSAAAPPEEVPLHTKSSRSSMKRKKRSSSEVPCQEPTAELPQNPKTPKCVQSKLNFNSCVVKNSGYPPDDVKAKTKPVRSSKTTSPGDSNPSSGPSAPAATRNTRVNLEVPKDVISQLNKEDTPPPKKKSRSSWSALARRPSLPSESLSAAQSFPAVEEDDVFEDYFSPANHKPLQQRPSLPWLPVEDRIQLPFQLAPAPPGKRNPRGSEASAPDRKRRPDDRRHSEDPSDHRWREGRDGPATRPAAAEPVPSAAAGPSGGPARPARARGRRPPPAPAPEMDTDDFESRAVSRRVPSNPTKAGGPGAARGGASRGPREQSEGEVRSGAVESE